jgi:hypothetical protein
LAFLILCKISSRFAFFICVSSCCLRSFSSSFLYLARSLACFLTSSFLRIDSSAPNALSPTILACDVIFAALGSSNLKLYFYSKLSISSSRSSSSLSIKSSGMAIWPLSFQPSLRM